MANLNIEALRIGNYHGKQYKKIKSFINKPKKANELKLKLMQHMKTSRFPPVIEKVRIGLGFGYVYRVCIPKDMEVNKL